MGLLEQLLILSIRTTINHQNLKTIEDLFLMKTNHCVSQYITSQTEIGFHERQQLPLRLAWALTIHKSQGITLPKAWIDIVKSERTAGVSYVAISRVKSLASCVIEPMTYERLTGLKSSANLLYRLDEENRLDQLAQATSSVCSLTIYFLNNSIYYIITNLLLVITVCMKI